MGKSTDEPGGFAGLWAGATVGAMLTASLTAVLYTGWRLAGLPFVPFDLFDWTARVLPGGIIEFGISAIVAVIRVLHLGATSVAAKEIEQAMGISGLLMTGVIGGAVLFMIMRALRGRYGYAPGLAMGAAVGIPALLISRYAGQTARVSPAACALWVLSVFLLWGAAIGLIYQRLFGAGVPAKRREAGQASVERVDRRQFLIKLAGATAVITVSGALAGALSERFRSRRELTEVAQRWSAVHSLPNADAAIKPAPGTRPEYTPLERHYRIDINTVPPKIDVQRWRLKIGGLVEKPLALTIDELRSYEPVHQFITLSCISNPVGGDLIGTTRWTGVSLKRILPDLRLKPGATHLKIRSADGFYEAVPLEAVRSDDRVMLVYAWDGVPLPEEHGFPLRIYIPGVYGMKQPKWIESIEATDHWEPGYWVVRGWDKAARMKATSVIDTVAVDTRIINANRQTVIPIGGIAHAGARGISRVEVQVDGGPWQQAELRTPISDLTWVVWRYDWPFQSGKHTFTVRCYDGGGAPQIVTPSPPAPSGASGLYRKTRRL